MSTRRAGWLVAGLLAILAATVLALTPLTAHGVDCGTALAPRTIEPTDGTGGEYVTSTTCTDSAQDRRITIGVLAILGSVALVSVLSHARWTDTPLHQLGTPST
jgi:hypothetical protein